MKPFRWTHHALTKAKSREVDSAEVEKAIEKPDVVIPGQVPREIYMRHYFDSLLGCDMLLRIVVEETYTERVIVTLYKTSNFKKYGMEGKI